MKNTTKLQNKEFYADVIIGGEQKHQSIKTDGICTCLTSSMGCGGGYVPMIILRKEINIVRPYPK